MTHWTGHDCKMTTMAASEISWSLHLELLWPQTANVTFVFSKLLLIISLSQDHLVEMHWRPLHDKGLLTMLLCASVPLHITE